MHVGFVLLNCDLGAEEYILDELKQIPQIKNAHVTFGAYDIITEIHAETKDCLLYPSPSPRDKRQ